MRGFGSVAAMNDYCFILPTLEYIMKCVLHPLSFVRLAWFGCHSAFKVRRRVVATFKFYSLKLRSIHTPRIAIFVFRMFDHVTTLLETPELNYYA